MRRIRTTQRLEELEKQKEERSLSMTTAELQKPKLTREYMEHWFSQFRYGDPNDREFQKRLIDTFVNAIFVYDDKLVLTYQHGTQTITLKEVDDFLGADLVGLPPPISPDEDNSIEDGIVGSYFKEHSAIRVGARFRHQCEHLDRSLPGSIRSLRLPSTPYGHFRRLDTLEKSEKPPSLATCSAPLKIPQSA